MDTEFTKWLHAELEARGWSQSDLARRGGVTAPSISRVASGQRAPGLRVCGAIAVAFGISVYDVMRRAGIEKFVPSESEEAKQLLRDFYQMPKKDQVVLKDVIHALRVLRDQQAEIELKKKK